jgi:hypothetical protein
MDEAFSEEEQEGMSGMQATRNPVTGRNPTVRDFLNIARCARGRAGSGGQHQEHRRLTRTTVR